MREETRSAQAAAAATTLRGLRYQPADDACWYHFLYGHVPYHQLDFIYSPAVSSGDLRAFARNRLAELIKYMEPAGEGSQAFLIGNLSLGDTQHIPGWGGIALIAAARVRDARDHAGRARSSFAHGIVTVNRLQDEATLEAAARVLQQTFDVDFYGDYVRAGNEDPASVSALLRRYVRQFDSLPIPTGDPPEATFAVTGRPSPARILVVCDEDDTRAEIVHAATRIATLLHRSDVPWGALHYECANQITDGISLRFGPAGIAHPEGEPDYQRPLRSLPSDDAELMRELFGAVPVLPAPPVECEEHEPPAEIVPDIFSPTADEPALADDDAIPEETSDPEKTRILVRPFQRATPEQYDSPADPVQHSAESPESNPVPIAPPELARPPELTSEAAVSPAPVQIATAPIPLAVRAEVTGPSRVPPAPTPQRPPADVNLRPNYRRWCMGAAGVLAVAALGRAAYPHAKEIVQTIIGHSRRSSNVSPPDMQPSTPSSVATVSALPVDAGSPPAPSEPPRRARERPAHAVTKKPQPKKSPAAVSQPPPGDNPPTGTKPAAGTPKPPDAVATAGASQPDGKPEIKGSVLPPRPKSHGDGGASSTPGVSDDKQ